MVSSTTVLMLTGNLREAQRSLRVRLAKGAIHRVNTRSGMLRITARQGTVWVTREGDSSDYVLGFGDEVTFPDGGLVLLEALSESEVEVG